MWACFESYLNKNKEKIGRLRGPRRRDKNYGLKKEYQNGATACDIQQWLQLSKKKNKHYKSNSPRRINTIDSFNCFKISLLCGVSTDLKLF